MARDKTTLLNELTDLQRQSNELMDGMLALSSRHQSAVDAFAKNCADLGPLLPIPMIGGFWINVQHMARLIQEMAELMKQYGELGKRKAEVELEVLSQWNS